MKHLTLMRHATAIWGHHSDFERPLEPQGAKDALLMTRPLLQRKAQPDILYISPAHRTKETATPLLKQLNNNATEISFRQEIYEATTQQLLTLIRNTPDKHNHLMLLGHNPALSDLAHTLTQQKNHNMSPASIHHLALPLDTWSNITKTSAKSLWHISPKKLNP